VYREFDVLVFDGLNEDRIESTEDIGDIEKLLEQVTNGFTGSITQEQIDNGECIVTTSKLCVRLDDIKRWTPASESLTQLYFDDGSSIDVMIEYEKLTREMFARNRRPDFGPR
jgi:hypothetical protein